MFLLSFVFQSKVLLNEYFTVSTLFFRRVRIVLTEILYKYFISVLFKAQSENLFLWCHFMRHYKLSTKYFSNILLNYYSTNCSHATCTVRLQNSNWTQRICELVLNSHVLSRVSVWHFFALCWQHGCPCFTRFYLPFYVHCSQLAYIYTNC